ncbi:hypothetical protein FRX31_027457, partial [Thalictrum thalictroides]
FINLLFVFSQFTNPIVHTTVRLFLKRADPSSHNSQTPHHGSIIHKKAYHGGDTLYIFQEQML